MRPKNNLTSPETWSTRELDFRLAKLFALDTPLEQRQLLQRWANEAFKRGMEYKQRQTWHSSQ